MIRLIEVSMQKDKGVNTIGATFQNEGGLIPITLNEEDRPESYIKALGILNKADLETEEIANNLFEVMSPAVKVQREISSSYYLSDNLDFRDGTIFFHEHQLEETLSNHMLSLLDDNDVPKSERMWKAFMNFLDKLYQNVSEDVKQQLFKWMDYENRAGNDFGIADDGDIIGYKGCGGTLLKPMSVFEGRAIVDGVEVKGKIPNKVGSVISMPRSEVQHDPSIGCSVGLHVGTRDYATNWADILILVKVNPRDIVSVPYEVDSQKMRVCEYTVMKVTAPEEEHLRFHTEEAENNDLLKIEDVEDMLYDEIEIEYDNGTQQFEGTIVDIFNSSNPGIVIKSDDDEYKHIKLHRISDFVFEKTNENIDNKDNYREELLEAIHEILYDELSMLKEELFSMIDNIVKVSYDDGEKEFEGTIVDIYDDVDNPGIIIKNNDDEYKHIKIDRVTSWCEPDNNDLVNSLDVYSELINAKDNEMFLIVYQDLFDVKTLVGSVENFDVSTREIVFNNIIESVTLEIDRILSSTILH